MFRVNFTPAVPKPDTDEPMAAKEEEPCHIAPCWSIILDNTWAHLRPGERAALAETCKDAYSIIRHRLQTHVSLHVSAALAEHLAGQGLTPLKVGAQPGRSIIPAPRTNLRTKQLQQLCCA